MKPESILQAAQQEGTTKQILDFVGARIDSVAPVLRGATEKAVSNATHYGHAWVEFRVYQLISGLIVPAICAVMAIALCYLSWFSWKRVYLICEEKVKVKDINDAITPWQICGASSAAIAFIVLLCVMMAFGDSLPKTIAALASPEGYAVQLLIDGIKGR